MAENPELPATRGRSLAFGSAGVFFVTIAIQLLGYLPTFYFAHGVGADPNDNTGRALLGTFQWFLLLASSINMIGDLRIGSAYTFYIARGESPKVGTGTYLALRVAMVGIGGLALWALGPALPYNTGQYLELFALWMALPLLWSLPTVYLQLWVAEGESVRGQMPQLLESIVRTAALTYIGLASLSDPKASFPTLIPEITYAYVLGAAVSALYSFPAVRRELQRYRGAVARRLFSYAWPLMGSLLLLYLSSTLVQFLVVVALKPDKYNVFLAANGWRILALAIPAAVAVPLFPHLSGLHRTGDYELIRQRTWAALRYTALAVIPVTLAMVVYRVNLLHTFYTAPYAEQGSTALALLALAAVPASLSQVIGTALNSVGKQRLELYLTALQVAVLVVASVALLDPFHVFGLAGLTAASLAVLLSSVAALLLNTYFMETLLGVRIQLRSIGTIAGASAVAFFAVSQFNDQFLVNRYYELFAGVALGFAAYAVVLAAVGELSKTDVRLVVGGLGLPGAVARGLARLCWREETWPVNPLPARGAAALVPLESDAPPPGPARPPK